jgi:hypothetical protein
VKQFPGMTDRTKDKQSHRLPLSQTEFEQEIVVDKEYREAQTEMWIHQTKQQNFIIKRSNLNRQSGTPSKLT